VSQAFLACACARVYGADWFSCPLLSALCRTVHLHFRFAAVVSVKVPLCSRCVCSLECLVVFTMQNWRRSLTTTPTRTARCFCAVRGGSAFARWCFVALRVMPLWLLALPAFAAKVSGSPRGTL
jgi:hypothetical protein